MGNNIDRRSWTSPPPQTLLPVAIAAASLLIDFATPNDIADGFLYMLAVLSCTWVPRVNAALYTALGLMLPMTLGYFVSSPAARDWVGLTNRMLGAVAVWLVAHAVWRNARLARERGRTMRQLERLHDAAERAADVERVELSRWLHEGLAQELAVVGWALDRLARDAADGSTIRADAAELRGVIDSALRIVHRRAVELRKPEHEAGGLPVLVEGYAADFARRTGLSIQVTGSKCLDSVPLSHAILCLTVVQEALTNAAKHADAKHIHIECREEPHAVRIVIADDGRGIDPDARSRPDSLGLLGLKERLSAAGGALLVSNVKPSGALIEATIPTARSG